MREIVFQIDEITPMLGRVSAALGDMTPVMQDIAELWLVSTQDRMLKGETPEGTRFAPRSPVTLARYAAMGFSFGGPLNLTGEMRGQLATEAGADFARIGSNAIQSAVMQDGASKGAFGTTSRGGSIPWGNIPARPFLGVSEDDQVNILAELEDWLTGEAQA